MKKYKVVLFVSIVCWLYACQPDLPPTPTTVAERPTMTSTPTAIFTPQAEGADPVPTIRPTITHLTETAVPDTPTTNPGPVPTRTPVPPTATSKPLPTPLTPPEPSPTAPASLPTGNEVFQASAWTTIGTPLPPSGGQITLENVSQLIEVGRWGKGIVREAVYSPDGTRLYVLTQQGVFVYDTATTAQVAFVQLDNNPNELAISPDGRIMAIGVGSRPYYHVEIWDIQSFTLVKAFFPFDEKNRSVWGLEFDSTGQVLFVMGTSIVVNGYALSPLMAAWDIAAQTKLVEMEAYDFDFAQEANSAVINDGNGLISLMAWENQNFQERGTFQIPNDMYESDLLTISPNGQFIALNGSVPDSRVVVWRIENDEPLYILESSRRKQQGVISERKSTLARPALLSGPGRDYPIQLLFSPDSQQLAVATGYFDVTIWQASDGKKIQEWLEVGGRIQFHPDGAIISTWRHAISQWQVDDGSFVNNFNQHFGGISDMALIPNSNKIAIASSDGYIYLRQWQTGDLFTSLRAGVSNETFFASPSVYDIDVTADGQTLVSASNDAYRVWDMNDYSMTTLSPTPRRDVGAEQIIISPDGKFILGQEYDAEVRLWEDGANEASRGPLVSPWAMAFSPVSNILAATESLYKARTVLWEVGTDRMMELPGADYGFESFEFSDDGAYLAGTTPLDSVLVWSIDGLEAELLAQISGGTLSTYGMTAVFSRDNRILVQSSRGFVRFWDMNDWSLQYSLDTGAFVNAMTFSPDGDYIITGHSDGSVRFWAVP